MNYSSPGQLYTGYSLKDPVMGTFRNATPGSSTTLVRCAAATSLGMNPGHVFNCAETYYFIPKKAEQSSDPRAFFLGPVGHIAFKKFIKDALPYEGPALARPAPSLTPEQHIHSPTNAGNPGAGTTQLTGEPRNRQAESYRTTTGTSSPVTTTIESTEQANPQRNTGPEALG
ncbi:hypothetical protein TGAMA5MH_11084 [Trichoderma gamsii]|uniref:Uncharacterized protein n=1 Tax=Trichoderma gamsii TaxID=398673 RepID=A0A2K0SUS8_9HYPO|nr:hypothetical protein TGAMA5MH_11084 [Trichoderma gamsii]